MTTARGEDPVTWVFVGLDGSLRTLHVEEGWREKMDRFWEEGVRRWAHDYVVQGNWVSAKGE
jgi:hypothetical protein